MVARADPASITPPPERALSGRLLLILPLLGALIYPALTVGLYASGRWASAQPGPISYLVVLAGLLAVFSIPFYGFAAAYRIGRLDAPTVGEHFMRVLYHLVAASPPLFGAFGMFSVMLRSSYGDYVAGSWRGPRLPSTRMTVRWIVGPSFRELWHGLQCVSPTERVRPSSF